MAQSAYYNLLVSFDFVVESLKGFHQEILDALNPDASDAAKVVLDRIADIAAENLEHLIVRRAELADPRNRIVTSFQARFAPTPPAFVESSEALSWRMQRTGLNQGKFRPQQSCESYSGDDWGD